jgi:outer membrane protein OmpA-like peptidoglycan-associated protein
MRDACLVALLLASAGCGTSNADPAAPPPAAHGGQPAVSASSAAPRVPTDHPAAATQPPAKPDPDQKPTPSGLLEAMGLGAPGRALPEGLEIGGDCPASGTAVDAEIAAEAEAVVPIKVGLTLVNLWKPTKEEEYECMTQVTAVHRDAVDLTMRCNRPEDDRTILRRICRADLAAASMLHTGVGVATVIGETGEELPETIVGATEFSLSHRQFEELKRTGQTAHHYVQVNPMQRLEYEVKTTLRREGTGKAKIAVNGSPVELPVILASADAEIWGRQKVEHGRVKAAVVDDERFPMLVDYTFTVDSSPAPRFRLYFPKVTYPGGNSEGELARSGKLIVHGIYFEFNSDRIQKESDPILKELGDLLSRHPDWTLSINGHTDNVGGDAYNQRLSQRRAASVVRWLVERHGIAASRLRSAGFGASSPIEPNDTPEGRARNRRVELVRVEDAPADPPRR